MPSLYKFGQRTTTEGFRFEPPRHRRIPAKGHGYAHLPHPPLRHRGQAPAGDRRGLHRR